ncbi:MAG: 2-oxo-4-hydroxy-4-carboxy-5-ureidoimidazoline decarboxylase [Verrucomicrobiota bacterium]|nr:2-oxo-4-hydroxy-4-carboxy-5-ureidoimidazoline decarboxylase [Verrucomicrobiota bacterium]
MLKLSDVNGLSAEEFVRVFAPVFERSPWIAARAEARRPFASSVELHAALRAVVQHASSAEKLALICAHPDLVGNAVLTAESQGEQASAGLSSLTPAEAARFRDYNERYRTRFAFPFVICARLHKKEAILRAFSERLENSREKEIETALAEIYKIADLRLRDLIE